MGSFDRKGSYELTGEIMSLESCDCPSLKMYLRVVLNLEKEHTFNGRNSCGNDKLGLPSAVDVGLNAFLPLESASYKFIRKA